MRQNRLRNDYFVRFGLNEADSSSSQALLVVLEETLRVLSLAAEVVIAHEHNVDVVDQRANVLTAEVVGEDRPHALDRGAAGLDEDELLRKRHPLRGFGGNRTDYFSDLSAANRLFQQSESTTRFYY